MTQFVREETTSTYGRPSDLVKANYKKIDPLLVQLLSKCTPHGFESHIVQIIAKLPFIKQYHPVYDPKMFNYIVRVGESRTLFSCHMDIVGQVSKHNADKGNVDEICLLTPDPEKKENEQKYGMIYGAKRMMDNEGKFSKFEPSTLGADDKAGVFILLKMIEKGIPGTYIFHTGEECGAKGSSHLATNHKNIFKDIDRAIAFDRANYGDVISFQRGRRCSSIKFSEALALELNRGMPPKQQFKADIKGVFTDTASYMDMIPECTNISVGYFNQHGSSEHLDTYWLETWLLPAILNIEYEKLPTERDPTKKEYESYNYPANYSNYHGNIVNMVKVPWHEATKDTAYSQFPIWTPKVGIPEGVSDEVLQMAVARHIGQHNFTTERPVLTQFIIDLMQYKEMMEEEITSLQIALALATGTEPPQKALPKPLDHDNHVVAYFDDLRTVVLHDTIDEEEDTVDYPPRNIELKKSLLTRLVVVSEIIILKEQQHKWLMNYQKAAKKLLTKTVNITTLIPKQLKKFNIYIYSMAALIDYAAVISPLEEKLLDEIQIHIGDTAEEEGWFVEVRGELKKSEPVPTITTIH